MTDMILSLLPRLKLIPCYILRQSHNDFPYSLKAIIDFVKLIQLKRSQPMLGLNQHTFP